MSRSAIVIGMVAIRPNTLNVCCDKNNNDTKKFIREALHAWRAKVRCNVVPAERIRDLFEELNFSPTERQLNEMLQTAKLFARRGSGLDGRNKHINGLTFAEFFVLAADIKRFRTQNPIQRNHDRKGSSSSLPPTPTASTSKVRGTKILQNNRKINGVRLESRQSTATTTTTTTATDVFDSSAPEVFLGGSCNPTTWRADVAIPTLNEHGISFYNPQVSDWTPDLIELEHRAKEKARVLFFVMDSETRASAGAIEAAHIAGQNTKHLVLVLHPYKPDQCILNEPISREEFLDLRRNQQLLMDLLTQRGLPILDSIPSGLQRTRAILAGNVGQQLPYNIASRLISVRHAFDRVISDQALDDQITVAQCQCALTYLGYAQNLLSTNNLKEIIETHRQMETNLKTDRVSIKCCKDSNEEVSINFDEFCMLTSYLMILQQEIFDSGCISPIKGTNLPPPPIFLTNTPEWVQSNNSVIMTTQSSSSFTKRIHRTSSCKNVPDDRNLQSGSDLYRNRDSGTSSPQPHESKVRSVRHNRQQTKLEFRLNNNAVNSNGGSSDGSSGGGGGGGGCCSTAAGDIDNDYDGNESDSNDSVFSSDCSVDSNYDGGERHSSGLEICDLYLGGSCMLRTKWRTDIVIPMLIQRNITYHLPTLHESIATSIHQYEMEKNPSNNNGNMDGGVVPKKRNKKSVQKNKISENNSQELSNNLQITEIPVPSSNNANDEFLSITRPRRMFNPALLEASRVLLFVITNETRSLAPMTLVAHYIGLGYNVVLCVQMLPEFCVIGNDRLTCAAIKDYNRGRSYLIDLAKRQGVPVFFDIKQAVECAIEKVKNRSRRSI